MARAYRNRNFCFKAWAVSHPTLLFALLLLADVLFLMTYTSELSISDHEARIVYVHETLLHDIVTFSMNLLGWDDLGLRMPFILMHAINAILIYRLSQEYLKKPSDALLSAVVFLLLPGVNSAALIVSKAGFLMTLVLSFILLFPRYRILSYLMLGIFMILDNAFAILFLALFFYALYRRDNRLIVYALVLFAINMYIFGFDDGGKPRGFFLDTFGVYAVIFSPLVFLYFFYSLYRTLIKEEKTVLWYIAFTVFAFSLLLSFRQKIRIEDFAPLFVIGTPLMVKTFLSGYRVRIPEFRVNYYRMFQIVIFSLVASFIASYWNKPLYLFYPEKENHFAYKSQIAKELAGELKERGYEHIRIPDEKWKYRLRFYGIREGGNLALVERPVANPVEKVSIFYISQEIASFYVTK